MTFEYWTTMLVQLQVQFANSTKIIITDKKIANLLPTEKYDYINHKHRELSIPDVIVKGSIHFSYENEISFHYDKRKEDSCKQLLN